MSKAESNFQPDYDFLTEIHDDVNFYDIVRELQNTGRDITYDSDILYCMVKAAKKYHESQLQELREKAEKELLYQGINPNEATGVRNVLELIDKAKGV